MARFVVEGVCVPRGGGRDAALQAIVLTASGPLAGSAPVRADGAFTVPTRLSRPAAVEVLIAPPGDPAKVDRSRAPRVKYAPNAWTRTPLGYTLHAEVSVSDVHHPLAGNYTVAGHVHKLVHAPEGDALYPVVGALVEVFDVDREPYPWESIQRRRSELRYVRTVSLAALMEQPEELPLHAPARTQSRAAAGAAGNLYHSWDEIVALNPQPEPPASLLRIRPERIPPGGWTEINPQPEPPGIELFVEWVRKTIKLDGLVGELRSLPPEQQAELAGLTLVSPVAPWDMQAQKFYSKHLLGKTPTDAAGAFRLDFDWHPQAERRGRLQTDARPDIIVRVTQTVNGVQKVIYLDPYTGTRWDESRCEVELVLDDPAIEAGPASTPADLAGGYAALTQIGCDPVWRINQAVGCYEETLFESPTGEVITEPWEITNAAYGGPLWIRGNLGFDMLEAMPHTYYRLSYAKLPAGAAPGDTPPDDAFAPIATPLAALRGPDLSEISGPIDAAQLNFTTHVLGPQTVAATENLYEVQDRRHWWIIQGGPVTTPGGMVLGLWDTTLCEPDEGLHVLRMEVFDAAGEHVNVAFLDFPHAATGNPSASGVTHGHADVRVLIDNAPLVADIDMGSVVDEKYGTVTWAENLDETLFFPVHISQKNGRVGAWSLHHTQGLNPYEFEMPLDVAPMPKPHEIAYASGVGEVNEAVRCNPLLRDPLTRQPPLARTAVYLLHLYARSHVRTSWGWRRNERLTYPLAIVKCSEV